MADGSGIVEGAPAALRRATAADAGHVLHALTAAFLDDPVIGWLLPTAATRPARLRRFFEIELLRLFLPRGEVWTTDAFAGALLVLPPGDWRIPLGVTLLEGQAFWANVLRASRVGAAMDIRHAREIREPHWYVRDVGVVPARQGQGVGSALLRPLLERCDRDGVPAYLEATSERSAGLYERLGFAHLGVLRIGGCPPMWPMLRAPRP